MTGPVSHRGRGVPNQHPCRERSPTATLGSLQVWFVDADGRACHATRTTSSSDVRARGRLLRGSTYRCWEDAAGDLLTGLGCHPLVLEGCRQRNYVPDGARVRRPRVRHRPSRRSSAAPATSTCSSSDQIIGHHYLVTVHGPINPGLDIARRAGRDRRRCWPGMRGRAVPPEDAGRAVVRRHRRRSRAGRAALIREVAAKLPGAGEGGDGARGCADPEVLLETMFLIRHELITTRTMAAQCHDIWTRMAGDRPARRRRATARTRRDLADQFDRVRSLADGESHVPVRRDRALPDQGAHQDDRRDGAAGRDRRRHPADHRDRVGLRHERHRQRRDPLPAAVHRPRGDGRPSA